MKSFALLFFLTQIPIWTGFAAGRVPLPVYLLLVAAYFVSTAIIGKMVAQTEDLP